MWGTRSQVESRVVRMFWNDGLLDVMAGAAVVLIGVAWLCDLVALGAVVPALVVPLWVPLRAQVTRPRMGYVELSDQHQRHQRAWLTVSIVCGLALCLALALPLVGGREILPVASDRLYAALPAGLLGLLGLLAAGVTGQMRFVAYAWGMLLCGIAVAVLGGEPGWAILAGGVLVLVVGVRVLVRFVHRYPLANQGGEDDAL